MSCKCEEMQAIVDEVDDIETMVERIRQQAQDVMDSCGDEGPNGEKPIATFWIEPTKYGIYEVED